MKGREKKWQMSGNCNGWSKKSNMRSSSQSNETEKYIRITDDWSLDMYFCGGRPRHSQ